MNKTKLTNNIMLMVPALLWGSSFSVRKMAAAYMTNKGKIAASKFR